MLDRSLTAYYQNVPFDDGTTNKGLPQGSIISPLLFNIYLSEIVQQGDENMKIISFADDVCIYSSNGNIDMLKKHLYDNLILIEKWLLTMNLQIAFNKTHLMLFGPNGQHIPPDSHCIIINSAVSLYNCAQVRYLGVLWDHKLEWSQHVLNIRNTARRLLSMMSSVAGFEWGAHPEILLTVFKTLIRPKMDWGSFLFANAKKQMLKCLDVIQNSALRIALGCMRTTPINVLHHLAGIEPLSICRNTLAAKFIIKSMSSYDNVVIPRIKLLDENTLDNQRLSRRQPLLLNIYQKTKRFSNSIFRHAKDVGYTIPYEALSLQNTIDVSTGREILSYDSPNPGLEEITQALVNQKYPGYLKFYTDGSKTDIGFGAGLYLPNNTTRILTLHSKSSIFTAESLAILEALNIIKNLNNHNNSIIL